LIEREQDRDQANEQANGVVVQVTERQHADANPQQRAG
jgi:hypothetical protein